MRYSAPVMSHSPETETRWPQLPQRDVPDRTLMIRADEGDLVAALGLVDRYAGPLYNLVYRATGMAEVAADVTRQTLSAAVAGLSRRVPKAGERWFAELARGAYRQLLSLGLRGDQATAPVRIASRHWEPERLHIARESGSAPRRVAQKLRQRLWRSWSDLSLRERFVLTLADTAQFSSAELAAALGESDASARRIRDEAKRSLMANLAKARPSWRIWLRQRRRGRAT
jgi:RNA polymerase sigma-70 factor, ECF subfamily